MFNVIKPFNSRLQKFSVTSEPVKMTDADVSPNTIDDLERRGFIKAHKPKPEASPLPRATAGGFKKDDDAKI